MISIEISILTSVEWENSYGADLVKVKPNYIAKKRGVNKNEII